MRTATDIKIRGVKTLDLPVKGKYFVIDKIRFQVIDVLESFNDLSGEHQAEIYLSSKSLRMTIVLNSLYPFKSQLNG